MHNSYFALRIWLRQARGLMEGATLREIRQRQWRELAMSFVQGEEAYTLKTTFVANNSFLAPVARPVGAQWQPIFNGLNGHTVARVVLHRFDRSFRLETVEGAVVLFRLHGNAGNVHVQLTDADSREVLRWRRTSDIALPLTNLPEDVGFSLPHLLADQPLTAKALGKLMPPLGAKPIQAWLGLQGFDSLPLQRQHDCLNTLHNLLDKPALFCVDMRHELTFGGLPMADALKKSFAEIGPALVAVEKEAGYVAVVKNLREQLTSLVERRIARLEKLLDAPDVQSTERLSHSQKGDLVMANLHSIATGAKKALLYDFYHDREVELRLNPDLSPQKNAEVSYQKARNEHLAAEARKRVETLRWEQLGLWQARQAQLAATTSPTMMSALQAEWQGNALAEESAPFNGFDLAGYTILVGRNAQNNDELVRCTHKDDLWLHARDATGSHVVIKRKGLAPPPDFVIEQAAETAAWFSKRRTDSLCPVIVTEKKWVLKPKGAAPGAVRVLRERVVLVVPRNRLEG